MEFTRDGTSTAKPLLLYGSNYAYWKVRMTSFLSSINVQVWNCVELGYTKPTVVTDGNNTIPKPMAQWTKEEKEAFTFNSRELNVIFNGVTHSEFHQIFTCKIAKEAQEILEIVHEDIFKVKKAKLQKLSTAFETLKHVRQ